jgi:adenylate kinase family enzyme
MNQMTTFPYQRICVVGTTGSGKSTLALELARRLQIPHVELDALHWGPNWIHCSDEEMRHRAEGATRSDAWVVDGNYSIVRDLIWPRAEVVVWLDYPLPLILWWLWKRTWKRVLSGEILWGTNRERLWQQFFSKDSLFLWALQTYQRRKGNYTTLLGSPEYANLKVYRFKSPREKDDWLRSWVEIRTLYSATSLPSDQCPTPQKTSE